MSVCGEMFARPQKERQRPFWIQVSSKAFTEFTVKVSTKDPDPSHIASQQWDAREPNMKKCKLKKKKISCNQTWDVSNLFSV